MTLAATSPRPSASSRRLSDSARGGPRFTRRPRARAAALAVCAFALSLLVGGCADGNQSASASLDSEPRPRGGSELEGGSGSDHPDQTVPGYGTPELTIPDVSIPDLSVPEVPVPDFPGIESTQRCLELTEAYTQLTIAALDKNAATTVPELFEVLAAEAPDDIMDDLEYVRDAVVEASDGSLFDAGALYLDDRFNRANEVIFDWLMRTCEQG